VYGHNIKTSDDGLECKLGDFGAAFVYGKAGSLNSDLVQRVEVRAFGVLCLELATRCPALDYPVDELLELGTKCHNPIVADRPSFSEIVGELKGIRDKIKGKLGLGDQQFDGEGVQR
jgi:hypothetical protein